MQGGGGITFTRNEKGDITNNLLIKGNNLIALHTLKTQFAGKVKLIYIDPPYNTGNDSFKYHDRFKHSTWLTFMKNRLEIAKELLSDDGVIFVQIDDNEQAYLKVLMDEIFGRDNFVSLLVWKSKNKPSGNTSIIQKVDTHTEYLLLFEKSKNIATFNLKVNTSEELIDRGYNKKDEFFDTRGFFKLTPLAHSCSAGSFQYISSLDYEIQAPDGTFFKNHQNLKKPQSYCYTWSKKLFDYGVSNGFIEFHKNENGDWIAYRKIYQKVSIDNKNLKIINRDVGSAYSNLIDIVSSDNGANELRILFNEKNFQYPKPEALLQRIIEISTKEGDLVLDFFAGSGTTLAVAHKMQRQYIGIEQMDYIEDITSLRLQKVIAGEQGGISKVVNWQGGGSFIYLELAKYNYNYIDLINNTSTTQELLNLFNTTITTQSLLNYDFDFSMFTTTEKDFLNLELEDAKKFLINSLNPNMLYIPNFLKDDTTYQLTKEDIKTTKSFYKEKID
jgi:adenine-specific DNA-methyltransferase